MSDVTVNERIGDAIADVHLLGVDIEHPGDKAAQLRVIDTLRDMDAEIERLRQETVDLTEAIIDWFIVPSKHNCDALEHIAADAIGTQHKESS